MYLERFKLAFKPGRSFEIRRYLRLGRYPKNSEIVAKIPKCFLWFCVLICCLIGGTLWMKSAYQNLSKSFSVFGLMVDIVGITITFSEVQFFGGFMDGGDVERKRNVAKARKLRFGLFIIIVGFALQSMGVIFS